MKMEVQIGHSLIACDGHDSHGGERLLGVSPVDGAATATAGDVSLPDRWRMITSLNVIHVPTLKTGMRA